MKNINIIKNTKNTKKILFSSVCKPIGPSVGDADSVGYELLHGQVTRAQHIYSPRVVHKQFSLDYISQNIDTPSVVLHYPSKKRFIKELKKGNGKGKGNGNGDYDVVGIAFVLSTHHHAIEMCKLVREHSPNSKIILGGYGTVMTDEELLPHCDAICRGEGVKFMREYLGETILPIEKYHHPDIKSTLRVFSIPVSNTAMIFAGLGCPNGCDFCCTSHFFKKEHIPLLPTGESIFETMYNHKLQDKDIEHTIIDEDFLLNKARSSGFLKKCREKQVNFSTFCFASVKAISQYTIEEILEMGIDGLWVGYEGKKSGYSKHEGRNIDELIQELQQHGITVLTSMILGIPYQSEEVVRDEFNSLMKNKPTLTQYLIYGPTPGTPLYEKVISENKLRDEYKNDRINFYKHCTGFRSMVDHPSMQAKQIEKLQKEFYRKDFEMLGPSILRVVEVKLNGFKKFQDHCNPLLKQKAMEFRKKLIRCLPLLLVSIFGPKISLKNRLYYVKLIFRIFHIANSYQKLFILLAPIVAIAAFATWIKVILGLFEHPFTRKYKYNGRLQGMLQDENDNSLTIPLSQSHPMLP
ncbi:MAG: hypothetical protein HQK49_05340 [Oligoflexia bacterium]|nr:hypothetical protein [Oligoflexia bacterium]